MPSVKKLKSVCNSIAQHAVSALSFIHPHVEEAMKSLGVKTLKVDLTLADPCPENLKSNEPLHLSLIALRNRFIEILNSEGFSLDDITRIVLMFEQPSYQPSNYCIFCHAYLKAKNGKVIIRSIDWLGFHTMYNLAVIPEDEK